MGRKATPALITKGDWAPGSFLPPFGKHIAFGSDPARELVWTWRTSPDVESTAIRIARVHNA